jgi:TolB protein
VTTLQRRAGPRLLATLAATLILLAGTDLALQRPPSAAAQDRARSERSPLQVVFAAMYRPNPSLSPGHSQIYSVNEDGSDLRRLTFDDNVAYDWPVWAYGGRKILYTVDAPGDQQSLNGIYLMNADGSAPVRLLATRGRVIQPKLSPGGASVLFTASWEPFPVVALYRFDLETGRITNLTAVTTPELGLDTDPRWSPDGQEIIFTGGPAKDGVLSEPQIFVIDRNGGNRRMLTSDHFWYTDPAISPDGRLIAASTYRGQTWPFPSDQRGKMPVPVDWHVVVQERGSGEQRLLTRGALCALRMPWDPPCAPDEGPSWVPVWTPDGARIAFLSLRRVDLAGIYAIDRDGGNARTIVELPDWIVIWHDWSVPAPDLATSDAPVIGGTASSSRILYGALTYPTRHDPAGNFGFDFDRQQEMSTAPQLFTASVSPWIAEAISWPHGDLIPTSARWAMAGSAIVFTARTPASDADRPDRSDAIVVPRSRAARPAEDPLADPELGLEQVFLAAVDGSWVRQLTTPWTYDPLDAPPASDLRANLEPDVSPDGRFVVFASVSSTSAESWILRMDLATGEVVNLSSVTCGFALCLDRAPRYAPDGSRIVFTSLVGGAMQLFVMDADGGQVRRLTDGAAHHLTPAWSPNGSTIAYVRTPVPANGERADAEPWTIETIDVASLERRVVAEGVTAPMPRPVWAPDGQEIAFVTAGRTGQPDISVVPASGGPARPLLVSTTAWELFLDWR